MCHTQSNKTPNGNIIASPISPPPWVLPLLIWRVCDGRPSSPHLQTILTLFFFPLIKLPLWVQIALHPLTSRRSVTQPERITVSLSQAWHGRDANLYPESILPLYFCSCGRPKSNVGMHFPARFGCSAHIQWCSCQFNSNLTSIYLLKTESQPWSFYFFHLPTGRKSEVRSNFGSHQPGFLSHCVEQSCLSFWNAQLGIRTWERRKCFYLLSSGTTILLRLLYFGVLFIAVQLWSARINGISFLFARF